MIWVENPGSARTPNSTRSPLPNHFFRNRQFVYKRAEIRNAPGTLEAHLSRAVDETNGPAERQEQRETHTDSETYRFVNSAVPVGPIRCGGLFEFTKGFVPPGFRMDKNAKAFEVEALVNPGDDRHFLESALYFGVMGYHLVIMPTGALSAGSLQDHFNWLLKKRTQTLPDEAFVQFLDEPAAHIRDGWQGVRGLSLQSKLSAETLQDTEQEPNRGLGGMVASAIKRFGLNLSDAIGDLDANQVKSLDRLGARLELRYAGRTEKIDTRLLDNLVKILPDDDTIDIELDIRGVGRVRAGQMKVSKKRSVRYENGAPVLSDVAASMYEWLYHLIETQRVRA
jgi:hypothetical protein